MKEYSAYKNFLAEREKILHYKHLESELTGHDIGFEQALFEWGTRHRSTWKETQEAEKKNSYQKQDDK